MNSNNFFLDIFNELLKINEDNIIIVFDINGDIWFALRDILKALGYSSIKKVIYTININTNNKKYYKNISILPNGSTLYNSQPSRLFINESCQIKIFIFLFGNNTL